MKKKKELALDKLHHTFQYHYNNLVSGQKKHVYDIKQADDIASIYQLYEIVEKMPIWPFNMKNWIRFFSLITLPVIVFIIEMLTNTDSVFWLFIRRHFEI